MTNYFTAIKIVILCFISLTTRATSFQNISETQSSLCTYHRGHNNKIFLHMSVRSGPGKSVKEGLASQFSKAGFGENVESLRLLLFFTSLSAQSKASSYPKVYSEPSFFLRGEYYFTENIGIYLGAGQLNKVSVTGNASEIVDGETYYYRLETQFSSNGYFIGPAFKSQDARQFAKIGLGLINSDLRLHNYNDSTTQFMSNLALILIIIAQFILEKKLASC